MKELQTPQPTYIQLLKKWRADEYDGLKGLLPDWLPPLQLEQFSAIQSDLCHGVASGQFTEAQLLQQIHFFANAPGIARFNSGMTREADFILLADLLRTIEIAVRQSVQHALQFLIGVRLANAVQTGAKIKASATKGHEKVHGTKEEKEARRKLQRDAVARIRAEHPKWSWSQVTQTAAEMTGVCKKTIQRNVLNPDPRPRKS